MSFNRELLPDAIEYFESQNLTLVGAGTWKTTACQFHGGSDSLRINSKSGGWCCMACGAKGGDILSFHMQAHDLEFIEAAKQLGTWINDDMPSREYRPTLLSPRAALEILAFETNLVAIAAANIAHGVILTDDDRARVVTSAGRINLIARDFA